MRGEARDGRETVAMAIALTPDAERTVKAHRKAAMRKTGARSIAGLVRCALRNRIVEP